MQTIINNAIEEINQGASWVNGNLKVDKMAAYKTLVKKRRTLKKIRNTYKAKPAVALYGESQCGKSHLSSSLLSVDGKPMKVVDRINGQRYEYLTHLNPPGSGEATGLITRFTTRQQEGISKEYPVHLRLMSVKDIALMLCDGYYRDYENRETASKEEVNAFLEGLKDRKTGNRQCYLSEDDIGEMEEYFDNFFSGKYVGIDSADYFGKLSLIVEYLDESDVIKSINMLWNNDSNLSGIFRQFFEACKKVEFVNDAYISFDELDNSKGLYTLLDVRWLNLKDTSVMSRVRCKASQGGYKDVTIAKAYLATICSEVVLEVDPPKFETKSDSSEKIKYICSILEHVDILDFPGARARGGLFSIKGNEALLLRRGKVAYCFNKYSSERSINALLYCWHPTNFEAKPMQDVLHRWIGVSIGRDEEERSSNLAGLDFPPLFFVGTKFNLHLQNKGEDRADNPKALKDRWEKWFDEQLSQYIIGTPNNESNADLELDDGKRNNKNDVKYHEWFESWTQETPDFDNIYLLRDFRYSTNIFDGWTEETGRETARRSDYEKYDGFYQKLRDSFLNSPFVKRHFRDAEKRWDEASEVNCDGSLTIARNLASIVEKIANVASAKNKHDVEEAIQQTKDELKKHYYSSDSEDALRNACGSAARLQSSLHWAFGKDPNYFGRLMKAFTISEANVYQLFHEMLGTFDPKSNLGQYVFIYMKAPGLSPSNSYEVNLEILRNAYKFANVEECEHHFKDNLRIDLEDLFRRNQFGLQSPSQILATSLKSFYFDEWLAKTRHDDLVDLLSEGTYEEVKTMLLSLFEKFKIDRKIANEIHVYVDTFGNDVEELSEMIADMCAEMINRFVLSVGYDYYSKKDEEIDDGKDNLVSYLKEAEEQHHIGLSFKFIEQQRPPVSDERIAELLDKMSRMTGERIQQLMMTSPENSEDEIVEAVPGYRQSQRWLDLARMGFVLTSDIPNYDIEANERLGKIIDMCDQNLQLCQHQQ